MPRRPRVFVEGGIYDVYNHFARGSELFSEPEEAVEFIGILRKARDRDDLRVYAWTLMSNHYHMAVRTSPVPLSRTMGDERETDGEARGPMAGGGESLGEPWRRDAGGV
jgi:REP element-mobilizing transposase RayT